MNMHSGSRTLGTGFTSFTKSATLYDLIESMDEMVSSLVETRRRGPGGRRPDPSRDAVIARKVQNLFLSGRVRFKRFNEIVKVCPEWFE